MLRSRRFHSLIGVVAWTTTAANTTFIVLDAVSLSVAPVYLRNLLTAAGAMDGLSLCCVAVFAIQYAWKRGGITQGSSQKRWLAICCIVPSLVALAISLASLIMIKIKSDEVIAATTHAIISHWTIHLIIQFIIWALAVISQSALFCTPLWISPEKRTQRFFPTIDPRDSVMSEVTESHRSTSLQMLEPVQPLSPLAALPSPTFSTRSTHSLRSWRESLHHAIRPTTSRTRLLSRPSFGQDTKSVYSDAQSISTLSQPDGFDMWDTSTVDPQTREAVLQSAPSRGTALETIPGSRPASPARALDGPFSTSPELDAAGLPMPPKMYADTSRPPSPAVSEGHIHPLFRSESPVPPPAATPGTSIIASPLSSQVIACPPRPYNRMRSNSRTASPSPLMHTKTFTTTGSRHSSRTPSPQGREMTPPIPDFVLNSSPPGSLRAKPKSITSEYGPGRSRPNTGASSP